MRESTAAKLHEKFMQTGLMILTLAIPIGSLAYLESLGVIPEASLILLVASSLMMLMIALLSVSRPVTYAFWIYSLLMIIWVVSFDLRTAGDLVSYLDGRSLTLANHGDLSEKLSLTVFEKEPSGNKDPKPIIKAEKTRNQNHLRHRAQELTKKGNIVAENGLWILYIRHEDFNDRNRVLQRPGLGRDHIERVLNAFIFW